MVKQNLAISSNLENGSQRDVREASVLKCITLLLSVVIIGLLLAIVLILVLRDNKEEATLLTSDGRQVCLSSKCVEASAYILNKMNRSVDPCYDMYMFSCGGWLANNRRPVDKFKWEAADELDSKVAMTLREIVESSSTEFGGRNSSAIEKLKTFYRNCMDEKTVNSIGTFKLLQLINKLGSWTLTSYNLTEWDRENWSLQTTLETMHTMGSNCLFTMKVIKDHLNVSRNIIYFDQSGLRLAESMYNDTRIGEALVKMVVEYGNLLNGDPTVVENKYRQVLQFEKNLANIYVPLDKINPVERYKKIKIGQLNDYFSPWLNITQYLHVQFNGISIPTDADVVFPSAKYFLQLKELINNTDKEVIANYMISLFISRVADYLPDGFRKAELPVVEIILGVKGTIPRYETCLTKARELLGFAISAIYVREYFPAESKAKVESTLQEIKSEFIANLNNVHWLDEATKTKVKEKAEAIATMIGYPDWMLNVQELDKYYDHIKITQGEYLYSHINYTIEIFHKELEALFQTPNKTTWMRSPDEINAYYYSLENSIVFLSAILQPPFFIPTFPEVFSYGTIGTVAGHEITHGFDSFGRFYDKNGNLGDLWSTSAAEAFNNGSKCFIDQYSSYKVQGVNLDGQKSLGENIADNGALKLAFRAFKKSVKPLAVALPGLNLTDDQLYFVGFSQLWCAHYTPAYEVTAIKKDSHSNNRYRVIGSVSNSIDFAQAFNCPIDSPMNPVKKCNIW